MHPRFEALLKWASQEYDLVIIDTPPILAVTDAAIIGRYVGTTLLVARYEANTAKEILISKRRFEQSGVEIKGCILNGVVKRRAAIMVMVITIMGIHMANIQKINKIKLRNLYGAYLASIKYIIYQRMP